MCKHSCSKNPATIQQVFSMGQNCQ